MTQQAGAAIVRLSSIDLRDRIRVADAARVLRVGTRHASNADQITAHGHAATLQVATAHARRAFTT